MLQQPNPAANDQFGSTLAVDDNNVLVGSNSMSAVYAWPSSLRISPNSNDQFGKSIALDGDYLVVGAHQEDTGATNSGAAYVYHRASYAQLSGSAWHYQAILKMETPVESYSFGASVAISGDTIVVTGFGVSQSNTAAAVPAQPTVFVRSGKAWNVQQVLAVTPPADTYMNTHTPGNFGYHTPNANPVAISGDTIVAGLSTYTGQTSDVLISGIGGVAVFVRSGTTWTQQAFLTNPDPTLYDTAGNLDYTLASWHLLKSFGFAVAISGDTIVVGAPYTSSAPYWNGANTAVADYYQTGAAYVYSRSGSTWNTPQRLAPSASLSDACITAASTTCSYFGYAVDVDGPNMAVGASGSGSNGLRGVVYMFHGPSGDNGLEPWEIALIAVGAVLFVALVAGVAWFVYSRYYKSPVFPEPAPPSNEQLTEIGNKANEGMTSVLVNLVDKRIMILDKIDFAGHLQSGGLATFEDPERSEHTCAEIATVITKCNQLLIEKSFEPLGLEVGGHTSASVDAGWQCSQDRADMVAKIIKDNLHNASDAVISAKGYSSTQPLPGFDDGQNHAENRRVEIVVTCQGAEASATLASVTTDEVYDISAQ
jgi:hypothetical protein